MPSKPHVVILGPAKDRAGKDWPLHLRLQMLKALAKMKCPAVVMERVPDLDGENPARKFDRIVRDWNVRSFLVVWPKGCRLNGLDVELGWLLREIVGGQLDAQDVHLVTQVDHLKIKDDRDEGVWAMGEPGNRTRYYGALVDEGCTIRKYATLPDLRRNALASAIEHLQRHVSAEAEREFIGKAAAALKDGADKADGKSGRKA